MRPPLRNLIPVLRELGYPIPESWLITGTSRCLQNLAYRPSNEGTLVMLFPPSGIQSRIFVMI